MNAPRPIQETQARQAFEQALETYSQDFETFFLARLLDLRFSYDEELCHVDMAVHDFMFNPQGSLHGGIIALLMDVSMGHLLKRHFGAGATLEMKTQFLSPIREGEIRATGSFMRRGRATQFLRSELRTADGELAAFATSTWKVLPKRPA